MSDDASPWFDRLRAGGVALALLGGGVGLGAAGSRGDTNVVVPPNPVTVERLSALEHRVEAVERQVSDPATRTAVNELTAEVKGLRAQLDMMLRFDGRKLDDGAAARRRR